jgi:beta-glucosidase
VIQLYGRPHDAGDDFPARVLVGFRSVALQAGESARVTVPASLRPLQRWTAKGFVPAAATVVIEASAYSGDPAAVTASAAVPLD